MKQKFIEVYGKREQVTQTVFEKKEVAIKDLSQNMLLKGGFYVQYVNLINFSKLGKKFIVNISITNSEKEFFTDASAKSVSANVGFPMYNDSSKVSYNISSHNTTVSEEDLAIVKEYIDIFSEYMLSQESRKSLDEQSTAAYEQEKLVQKEYKKLKEKEARRIAKEQAQKLFDKSK